MAEKTGKNLFVALAVWAIPLIIVISYSILASSVDLRLDQARLIPATGVIVISLASSLYLLENRPRLWSPALIFIIAALARLLFLFRPPELSDDIYRYLWDGFQLVSGRNPYALAPSEAASFMPDPAGLSSHINHPWLVTIYPPAAELLFSVAAALGGTLTSLKAILVLLDLALCALLLRWLPRLGLPASRAVLYAWNPLPVLEIAGSGHVDGAGLLLLFMTLAILSHFPGSPHLFSGRPVFIAAGILFALAVQTKLFPIIYLPFLLVLLRGRGLLPFVLGLVAASTLLALPFLPDLLNGLETLGIFAETWESSGFPYRVLLGMGLSATTARMTLSGVLAGVAAIRTAFLLKHGTKAAPMDGLLRTLACCAGATLAFLLLTPNLQPWYALWLAAFLPFAARPAGIVISWSVFIAYHPLIPYTLLSQWDEEPIARAAVWCAPVAAFLLGLPGAASRRIRRPRVNLDSHLP